MEIYFHKREVVYERILANIYHKTNNINIIKLLGIIVMIHKCVSLIIFIFEKPKLNNDASAIQIFA